MIDGLTVEQAHFYSAASPVSFEIPARAASRSSKLITNQGKTPPNQIAELTIEWLS
jgi:hypothetical protein